MHRALHRALLPAALLLPTLAVAAWAGWLALALAAMPALRVGIEGPDPRDIFRGHYLVAQLTLSHGGSACVCLTPDPAAPLRPEATPVACRRAELRACPYPLRDPGRLFRLYLPQEQAAALERLPPLPGPRASVRLRFDGEGGVFYDDLRPEPPPP
ncbi:hypothetical protein [Rhodocista pekingensis]|uniref:Uncharacterized protein n=1 Tax=Rhodocista pekingensis TaxID=201185 RepID=A0ABW2KVG7_9PROT